MINTAHRQHANKSMLPKIFSWVASGIALSIPNVISASAAQATPFADFFFTPPGTQLDSDPIQDIGISQATSIIFSPGLIDQYLRPAIYDSYTVNYRVSWDSTELSYDADPSISGLSLTSDFSLFAICMTNCQLQFTTMNPVNDGLTDFSYILDNVFINQIGVGVPVMGSLDKGGGIGFDITSSFSPINDFDAQGIPVTPGIGFQQVVEVQPHDIPQVPGPLPLLGVGAAFGYSRKVRRRIKSNNIKSKNLPVSSAID